MTNSKTTKRALLTSILALITCLVMLLGTTFAWFTDSVTSGNNVIASGNLDIELEYSSDLENWKTVENASDVFSSTLWEPGHTEVVYLRLRNAGSLVLKYNLGTAISNEVLGQTKNGDTIKLSDHIKFSVINDVTEVFESREAARTAAETGYDALAVNTLSGYGYLQPANSEVDYGYPVEKTVAMVVYMPESVANEANHDGVHVPSIELALSVNATQKTAEVDSFDKNYDDNASWIGNLAEASKVTYSANPNTATYTIENGAELAWIADFINSGKAAENADWKSHIINIVLGNDIDLNNVSWTAIGTAENPFVYNFDGQGYTVYNLNAAGSPSAGLFGDIGADATVKNVTVKNAYVESSVNADYDSYAGAIVARAHRFLGDGTEKPVITNCKAVNVTVRGKNAGGIVGSVPSTGIVNNNTTTDSTIIGTYAGGIVGTAPQDYYGEVTGSTVENNVIAADIYEPGKTPKLGTVAGRINSSAGVVEGNEVIDASAIEITEINTAADLYVFAASINSSKNGYSGKTVTLNADIDLGGKEWTPIGQTGTSYGALTYFQGTFDGNGHTISNFTISKTNAGANYAAGLFGFIDMADATIKNLKVTGADVKGHHWTGVIAGYITGTITGCEVTDSKVTCTHANNDACGDKAGIITGYVNQGTVTGNTVKNCSVAAGRDAGQVAGAAKTTQVFGNTIENVTVTATVGCTGANINEAEIGRVL